MNISERDGAVTFDVLVQPRASRAKLGPMHDGRLKVAVTAPPVDGEANAAVIELVAKQLGVSRRAVEVVAGETSRRKTLRVTGVTRALIEALALAFLVGCGGVTGTLSVSIVDGVGKTLVSNDVDTFRLTLTNPKQAVDITRNNGEFDAAFDVDTTNADGSFFVQGFDAAGNLLAVGQSPPIPIAAIDAKLVIFVGAPHSIDAVRNTVVPVRPGSTAFALPYGVVVAGGILPPDANGIFHAPLEVYNAYDTSIAEGTEVPDPRENMAVAVNQAGVVWLFGGDDLHDNFSKLYRFDPTQPGNGTYTTTDEDSMLARTGAIALPNGVDKFVISSGTNGIAPTPLSLDAASGQIAEFVGLPDGTTVPNNGASVVGTDQEVTAMFEDDMQVVRFHGDAFDATTMLAGTLRANAGLTGAPNGKIIIAGGHDASGKILPLAIVDAVTEGLTATPPMLATGRDGPAVASTANFVVVAGGQLDDAACPTPPCFATDAELFDAVTLAPLGAIPLPVSRRDAKAILLPNDQIMISGGTLPNGMPSADVEVFTPDLPASF